MDHSSAGSSSVTLDADEPQQYRTEFKREMGFWGNLALGFTPGSTLLRRFSESRAVPPYALAAAGLLPAAFVVISLLSADALIAIVSFAALRIYLAFASVVVAYLRARFKGWQPSGHFRMGTWGIVVACVALAYQLFAMFTLVQPIPDATWYEAWLVALVAIVVLVVGLIYMTSTRPYLNEPASLRDDSASVEPIAPTEEIVDMAVRLDGGTPPPLPAQRIFTGRTSS